MIPLLLSLLAPAEAAELHVVREGETVETIADALGDRALTADLRTLNDLAAGAEPAVGDVLTLPDTGTGVDQPAQVLALMGSGTVTVPGAAAQPLVEGTFLPADTQVCTGADSFATVRLASVPGCAEEDDVTLLPGTCMTVDGNHARTDLRTSVVSVSSGAIAVKQNNGTGRVAVRTPAGLTTGDNGGFRVAVEPSSTRAEAVTGALAVIAQGVEKAVPAGFGVRTPDGETPGDLVELLPPGTPTAPADRARLLVPDFAWTPVERALGYRIEVATDAEFTRLVRRVEVGRTVWEPTQLFLPYQVPSLHWRVLSFDRLGFEGIPSEGRQVLFPRGVAD